MRLNIPLPNFQEPSEIMNKANSKAAVILKTFFLAQD